MITCDNDCANCGKYTSVQYNGGEYTEYYCLVANKYVKKIYDEDGNVEKIEVF